MTIFNYCENTNQAAVQTLPKFGRLLGIDVGTKRIGLALSDASRFIASPKLIINRISNHKDFEKIKTFIVANEVVGLVIGRPINLDDNETAMTQFSDKFSQALDKFLAGQLPIFLFEERLTSFEARNINYSDLSWKKSKFVDDIAASFILQHFLDEFCC